jgi:GNAT superfamily N-acetyltransferase
MRPVTPVDALALVEIFSGLSPDSYYRRFFTLSPAPIPVVARHLARVDHRDHEAILVLEAGSIVAVAQWDRALDHQGEAEVAVVVVDRWQHRGLGTALIRALAGDARRHQVKTLTARVLTDNRAAVKLARAQQPSARRIDGSEMTFHFALAS